MLHWEDLPKWQKGNEFIRSGYRKPSYSSYRSMRDIKRVHNETVNIWSHLLAGIMFSIFLIQFLVECEDLSTDVIAVLFFFLEATLCFTLSFIHHLFSNHSKKIINRTQRLDHLGVVIVTWSSAISFTYFGFYCDRQLQVHYMCVVISSAFIAMVYAFQPEFGHPNSRLVRTFTYLALGFSASLLAIYLHFRAQEPAPYQRIIMASYEHLIILNSFGGLFYSTRIPERFYRKTFDIYGSSHQVMHVMVIYRALFYQIGLLTAQRYWRSESATRSSCTTA